MRLSRALTALLVVALSATACDRSITSPDAPITAGAASADVAIELGSATVALTYLGQPVGSLGAGCNFRTELISTTSGPSFALNICDQGTFTNIPVGTYTLKLYHWGVYDQPLVAPASVTITQGTPAATTFEVGGVMGIVTGSVTINGTAATSGGVCASVLGGQNCVGFAAGGTFKALVRAGTGTAFVWGNGCQCNMLGTMSITAVAGQSTDAGTTAIALGGAQVALTYNGQPVSALGAGCNFRVELISTTGGPSSALNICDQGNFTNIPAGSYSLKLYHWGAYSQTLVPAAAVTVTAGGNSMTTFEVNGAMGLVTGSVSINGAAPANGGVCATVDGGQNCVGFGAGGTFKMLLRAGSGSGYVWGNGCQCNLMGTFQVTAVAGATTPIPNVAIDNGGASVSIKYQGQLVSTLGAGCNFRVELTSTTGGPGSALNLCDSGTFTGIPVGSYLMKLYNWGSYSETIAPPAAVTITPAGNAVVSFEVSPVMGIVTGHVTINGAPANQGGVCVSVSGGQNCVGYSPPGTFKALVRAGAGTGYVWNDGCQCHVVGTFTFGAVANTTTDIGEALAVNHPPVIGSVGGPYSVMQGSSITLQATASDPDSNDPITYAWSFSDGSSATGATVSRTFSSPGTVTGTLKVTDSHGLFVTAPVSITVNADASAPVITPNVSGTIVGGWYTSNVVVSWSTSDPETGIASSTGCATSTLSTDVASQTYTCSATNGAGLTETKSVVVKRDATAPVVTYSGNAGTYSVDQAIAISCSAADPVPGSGIATNTCSSVSGPAYAYSLGAHALSASATDVAGNTGSASTTFTVKVSYASLAALVRSFCVQQGVASSLGSKLAAAADAESRGNANAKAGQLRAFANEVNAQSGKCMDADKAAILIALAGSL